MTCTSKTLEKAQAVKLDRLVHFKILCFSLIAQLKNLLSVSAIFLSDLTKMLKYIYAESARRKFYGCHQYKFSHVNHSHKALDQNKLRLLQNKQRRVH